MRIEDRRAVEAAVENWMNAWERRDPDLAVCDYAEKTDWTNVFGVSCTSRAELRTVVADMFSQPHVMAGHDTVIGQDIRFIGADVALAKTGESSGTANCSAPGSRWERGTRRTSVSSCEATTAGRSSAI
ncbi:MAG TPA: SgcJ/EcaC family oxidoreductase [Actinomycetota bacterium]|nr:SgcJ/EcaC family oxidoreductase [Actinomycetota bacterium]